jgi:hypothetical protein
MIAKLRLAGTTEKVGRMPLTIISLSPFTKPPALFAAGNVDPAAHVAAITMDLAEAMEAVELEAALLLGITDSEPKPPKSTESTATEASLKPEKPEQKGQTSRQETEEGSGTDGSGGELTSAKMEVARALLARHGAKLTQAWLEGASQTEEVTQRRQPLGSIDRNSVSRWRKG